jgi:hypothetical protein
MREKLLAGILCVLVVGCMTTKLSKEEEQFTQTIAQPVIEAINTYYKDKDDYPEQLVDLVPDHIAVLPKDTLFQDFDYRKENEGYALCFWGYPQEMNDGCCYHSRFEEWDCTDGH